MDRDAAAQVVALVVYAASLGRLRLQLTRPRARSLGAAAKPPGPAHGTVLLAVVVVIAATVLIFTGRAIPPEFTVVLATVAGWVGAGGPTKRR